MGMRNDEGENLRREIGQRRSSRGRLRRELRERCERYEAARAAVGTSQKMIADELGVSTMSVQRWLRAKPRPTAMVPVRIVTPPRPIGVAARAVVTTPRGLRIEGLDLDSIFSVIARFG